MTEWPDPGTFMREHPERFEHRAPEERHEWLDTMYANLAVMRRARDAAAEQAAEVNRMIGSMMASLDGAPTERLREATVDLIVAAERMRLSALDFSHHGGRDRAVDLRESADHYGTELQRWTDRIVRPPGSTG